MHAKRGPRSCIIQINVSVGPVSYIVKIKFHNTELNFPVQVQVQIPQLTTLTAVLCLSGGVLKVTLRLKYFKMEY